MKLVKLTCRTWSVWVNPEKVISVYPFEGATAINLVNDGSTDGQLLVMEPIDGVVALLNKELISR